MVLALDSDQRSNIQYCLVTSWVAHVSLFRAQYNEYKGDFGPFVKRKNCTTFVTLSLVNPVHEKTL